MDVSFVTTAESTTAHCSSNFALVAEDDVAARADGAAPRGEHGTAAIRSVAGGGDVCSGHLYRGYGALGLRPLLVLLELDKGQSPQWTVGSHSGMWRVTAAGADSNEQAITSAYMSGTYAETRPELLSVESAAAAPSALLPARRGVSTPAAHWDPRASKGGGR
jgi:hypothetical protein